MNQLHHLNLGRPVIDEGKIDTGAKDLENIAIGQFLLKQNIQMLC